MKRYIFILFCLVISVSAYSQTFNSKFQTSWESSPKLKAKNNSIIINATEISISNFLNGGTETLMMAIDSIVVKDYNFKESTWYYCHSLDSDKRKNILIVPTSNYKKTISLFDFADELTIFQYDFSY